MLAYLNVLSYSIYGPFSNVIHTVDPSLFVIANGQGYFRTRAIVLPSAFSSDCCIMRSIVVLTFITAIVGVTAVVPVARPFSVPMVSNTDMIVTLQPYDSVSVFILLFPLSRFVHIISHYVFCLGCDVCAEKEFFR